MLRHFSMTGSRGANKPLANGSDISKDDSDELTDATPYRQLVRSPLNLSNAVRPDIAFRRWIFIQIYAKAEKCSVDIVKESVALLKATKEMGLSF